MLEIAASPSLGTKTALRGVLKKRCSQKARRGAWLLAGRFPQVPEKLAASRRRVPGEVVDAILALARLSWGFIGKWDVALEYRVLRLDRDEFGVEQRHGLLAEIDYNVSRYVRLGVGWNFTHFSDEELGDLDRDTHGFFFRVVGRF